MTATFCMYLCGNPRNEKKSDEVLREGTVTADVLCSEGAYNRVTPGQLPDNSLHPNAGSVINASMT